MSWSHVGKLHDIPRLRARVVGGPRGEVAVFRTRDDEVFAVDNRCPCDGSRLSEGRVVGRHVSCPRHSWVVDLETGVAPGPNDCFVKTHAVRVVDGHVQLRFGENPPRAGEEATTAW